VSAAKFLIARVDNELIDVRDFLDRFIGIAKEKKPPSEEELIQAAEDIVMKGRDVFREYLLE
jgi:hypothetical protein